MEKSEFSDALAIAQPGFINLRVYLHAKAIAKQF